jgi:hypothetical protein
MYGPVRGLMLLSEEDADAAIKDQWAVDASLPYEYPADFDTAKAAKAGEDAAAKRAATAEGPKPKARTKDEPKAEAKEEPKEGFTEPMARAAEYQTRVSKPKE